MLQLLQRLSQSFFWFHQNNSAGSTGLSPCDPPPPAPAPNYRYTITVKHSGNTVVTMAYCWTQGLGKNDKHTSATAPGHQHDVSMSLPVEDAPGKDPYTGRILDQTKVLPSGCIASLTGQVAKFLEAAGRLPPRWSVQWKTRNESDQVIVQLDEWLASDMESPPSGALQWALDHLQARYQQQVEHTLESNPLVPKLLLYAALEEALQTNLQLQQAEDQSSSNNKTMGKQEPHPPLYYTTNPSSYLKPPTATDTAPTVTDTKVAMTAASLANRVRLGCQWAHRYVVAQMPLAPTMAAVPNHQQRRSLRQPKPSLGPTVPRPTPVQPGGRVAMWLLDQMEEMGQQKEHHVSTVQEEVEQTPVVKHTAVKKKVTSKQKGKQVRSPQKKVEHANAMDVDKHDGHVEDDDEDDQDDDTNKNDDDDDYGSKDADLDEEHDDDDDDLANVVKERKGNLTPVSDVPMDDVQGDQDKEIKEQESEDNIKKSIMYENPYLQPTFASFVEHLAKPKAMPNEDVQKAMIDVIVRIKFNKRSSAVGLPTESLSTVDQVVLDQETPDYPPGKVVLKCTSNETFSELQKLDAQAFSRCKFSLDIIGDEESTMQVQRKQELIMQEIKFKEQKAWCKWRHKGIHEGYATWPKWQEAIAEWVQNNCSVAASDAEPAQNDATTTQDDEALAKILDENEGGRRRTARRAAATASEGVYYGNQASLTQKNLMDALVRLVKVNQFMTLLRLQALVGDDSSDPIRRTRAALGKLVWKRNLLLRKAMDAALSDSHLLKAIVKMPLLTISSPASEKGEDTTQTQGNGASIDEQALIKYIHGLHLTELHLRRLVTKHLAEVPVAIIATAADERPGTMESMDSADFEEPSSIEWHKIGHDLLNKVIFRPAMTSGNSTDMTPCFWYRIQAYSKSIESDADGKEEPESKERRARFRAVPIPPPNEAMAEQEETLILTEAQVHAGMKAAEQENKNRASTGSGGNPFSGAMGDKVTLIPVDYEDGDDAVEIPGTIVGYTNVLLADDDDDDDSEEVEYRILVLPESCEFKEAFWASLDVRTDTSSYVCQPIEDGSSRWYSIEQFEYHHESDAYRQCETFLNWLSRQAKAGPFMQPVDPVALNIPNYPEIVKNPMDISTVSKKLQNGLYSRILPGQTSGISPTARMLNGPFRKDIELIFDNAMLFNSPAEWVYQAANQLKRNSLKKIADMSQAADQKLSGDSRFRQKRSVYVDDDSDVDIYEPNDSDNDEDFDGGNRRKRKRGVSRGGTQKDELAARAIEHPIRLQSTIRDNADLRGPFANLPINTTASTFSLPPQWTCRSTLATGKVVDSSLADTEPTNKRAQELAELLELQKLVEANEASGLRRSTRAQDTGVSNDRGSKTKDASSMEFFTIDMMMKEDASLRKLPSNRYEVEVQAEKLHEDYYSKLYQSYANSLVVNDENEHGFGVYSNGSFPPYMGRVVPISGLEEVSWEIRGPFVVPALRWVLRGLIQSGHLTAIEEMNPDVSSGVVMTNDIYYWDANLQPFEALDLRELQRKKRASRPGEGDSEEEIEMSEYEKARAERVARNAERLKALGLA